MSKNTSNTSNILRICMTAPTCTKLWNTVGHQKVAELYLHNIMYFNVQLSTYADNYVANLLRN